MFSIPVCVLFVEEVPLSLFPQSNKKTQNLMYRDTVCAPILQDGSKGFLCLCCPIGT